MCGTAAVTPPAESPPTTGPPTAGSDTTAPFGTAPFGTAPFATALVDTAPVDTAPVDTAPDSAALVDAVFPGVADRPRDAVFDRAPPVNAGCVLSAPLDALLPGPALVGPAPLDPALVGPAPLAAPVSATMGMASDRP
jgi:ribonuclease E